jgi:hypothetical protein
MLEQCVQGDADCDASRQTVSVQLFCCIGGYGYRYIRLSGKLQQRNFQRALGNVKVHFPSHASLLRD